MTQQRLTQNLQRLRQDLLKQTGDFFSRLENQIRLEAPREIDLLWAKAADFKRCVQEQVRKCSDGKADIGFLASLLNTAKVGNIIESSTNVQKQVCDSFEAFEKRVQAVLSKTSLAELPLDRVIMFSAPADVGLSGKEAIVVRREKSPGPTPSRLSNNLNDFKPMSPSRHVLDLEERSCDKQKEPRSSFLSKRHLDRVLLNPEQGDGMRKLNRSCTRPDLEKSAVIRVRRDPQLEESLRGSPIVHPLIHSEAPRLPKKRQLDFQNYEIRETQEENLLQASNAVASRLEIDLNGLPNPFERVDHNLLSAAKPETNRTNVLEASQRRPRSPLPIHSDMLKKVRSSELSKVDSGERPESSFLPRPKLEPKETTLEPVKLDLSQHRSRASSKNMSNININLDDFYDRPTARVSELLRNPRCLQPPHIDFSGARFLIRAHGRRHAGPPRILHQAQGVPVALPRPKQDNW